MILKTIVEQNLQCTQHKKQVDFFVLPSFF